MKNTVEMGAVIYSRIEGLVSKRLRRMVVVLVGLGSLGSRVLFLLLTAGIQRFRLIDPDRLSEANILRHVLDYSDVGLYKVTRLAQRVLRKIPSARVEAYPHDICSSESLRDRVFPGAGLIIATTDSNDAQYVSAQEGRVRKTATIVAGAGEEARELETHIWLPQYMMPCFPCSFAFRWRTPQPLAKRAYGLDPSRQGPWRALGLETDLLANTVARLALAVLEGEGSELFELLVRPCLPNRNLVLFSGGRKPSRPFSHPFQMMLGEIPEDVCIHRREE